MDHDFWWLMYDIDVMFHLLDIEELIADAFPFPLPNSLGPAQKVELTPDDEWLNWRLSRRRRRPKRQLHPCLNNVLNRAYRFDRSRSIQGRQAVLHRDAVADMVQQINDYDASQYTGITSVGMTIGNEYFQKNIGEYPLTYTDIADVIHAADVDDDPEPERQHNGFDSQSDYEEYLLECRNIADRDWEESSYDDDAAQFETA